PNHWNQTILVEVHRPVDLSILRAVVQRLIEHHDALRLRFSREEGGWIQFNAGPEEDAIVEKIDLSDLPVEDQSKTIEVIAAPVQGSLNITDGPVLRVVLLDLGEHKAARLLITIHHLIVDAISWRFLLEDLETAYEQLNQGKAISLPAKTTSFKRWAEQLVEYARSEQIRLEQDYWLAMIGKEPGHLPMDYPDAPNTVASAQRITVSLSLDETHLLLYRVPEVYRTRINEVLLTALIHSFVQWTGDHCLLIDLEGHGREEIIERIDLSRTVGCFTSIFP